VLLTKEDLDTRRSGNKLGLADLMTERSNIEEAIEEMAARLEKVEANINGRLGIAQSLDEMAQHLDKPDPEPEPDPKPKGKGKP
jgi:hypothetical protein